MNDDESALSALCTTEEELQLQLDRVADGMTHRTPQLPARVARPSTLESRPPPPGSRPPPPESRPPPPESRPPPLELSTFIPGMSSATSTPQLRRHARDGGDMDGHAMGPTGEPSPPSTYDLRRALRALREDEAFTASLAAIVRGEDDGPSPPGRRHSSGTWRETRPEQVHELCVRALRAVDGHLDGLARVVGELRQAASLEDGAGGEVAANPLLRATETLAGQLTDTVTSTRGRVDAAMRRIRVCLDAAAAAFVDTMRDKADEAWAHHARTVALGKRTREVADAASTADFEAAGTEHVTRWAGDMLRHVAETLQDLTAQACAVHRRAENATAESSKPSTAVPVLSDARVEPVRGRLRGVIAVCSSSRPPLSSGRERDGGEGGGEGGGAVAAPPHHRPTELLSAAKGVGQCSEGLLGIVTELEAFMQQAVDADLREAQHLQLGSEALAGSVGRGVPAGPVSDVRARLASLQRQLDAFEHREAREARDARQALLEEVQALVRACTLARDTATTVYERLSPAACAASDFVHAIDAARAAEERADVHAARSRDEYLAFAREQAAEESLLSCVADVGEAAREALNVSELRAFRFPAAALAEVESTSGSVLSAVVQQCVQRVWQTVKFVQQPLVELVLDYSTACMGGLLLHIADKFAVQTSIVGPDQGLRQAVAVPPRV